MKVINRSKNNKKTWTKTITCNGDKALHTKGCKAKLEISEKDLRLFHYFGMYEKREYLSVTCPICDSIIRKLSIPQDLYDRWKKKHPRAVSRFDGFDNRVRPD